ncbi:sortase-dependent protein [Streptomyces sp. NPDC051963]|uniref:sortase-dependent protein n=1 Tax=Streptomyces sp. NPDC051963 TaxID=3365678 RepID=UPI0037D2A3B8
MRRTVLSVLALACTAVLAGTGPALADETSPAPRSAAPSAAPTRDARESAEPTQAPSPVPSDPGTEPTRAPSGQVPVVPSGAPDTGVAAEDSGPGAGVIGGGTAAAIGLGGAAVFVVRRRRATGV